jgi:hypothetical protein
MINATKRLLIETLLDLAIGEDISVDDHDLSDHVRAIFLLISSHSIDQLPYVERISYQTYEDDQTGTPMLVSGVAVSESGMLLSDVVRNLRFLTKIPDELAEESPNLKYEDFKAALYAIHCIVASLEWDECLGPHEGRYSPETARRQISSSLKSLRAYRETGEP